MSVPAAFFCPVHRGIGSAQKLIGAHFGLDGEVEPSDADTGRDGKFGSIGYYLAADGVDDPISDSSQILKPIFFFEQDDELVTADARDRVRGTQRVLQVLGDGEQELIARGVACAVVDLFEPIEIGEQDADSGASIPA